MLQVAVGLEVPLEDDALDDDPQSDEREPARHRAAGHGDQQRRHVAGCVAAVVDQAERRPAYAQALANYLHTDRQQQGSRLHPQSGPVLSTGEPD